MPVAPPHHVLENWSQQAAPRRSDLAILESVIESKEGAEAACLRESPDRVLCQEQGADISFELGQAPEAVLFPSNFAAFRPWRAPTWIMAGGLLGRPNATHSSGVKRFLRRLCVPVLGVLVLCALTNADRGSLQVEGRCGIPMVWNLSKFGEWTSAKGSLLSRQSNRKGVSGLDPPRKVGVSSMATGSIVPSNVTQIGRAHV